MTPYSMLIQWSDPDQAFLVLLPEFSGDRPVTHGATYEEAARQGSEAMELLIDTYRSEGLDLPSPNLCRYSEDFGEEVGAAEPAGTVSG